MSNYKKYFLTAGLIWVVCTVVFIFVDMLVMTPQRHKGLQTEKQLREVKQTYRTALKAARKETQDEAKRQIQQMRNRLHDFVVDSEDSANVILDISRIATEKRLGSFSIKTKDGRESPETPGCNYIRENHIAVSFTGNFNQFAAFLNALERHRPVIFVDEFKMTRAKANDPGHHVNMSLAVLVKKQQQG